MGLLKKLKKWAQTEEIKDVKVTLAGIPGKDIIYNINHVLSDIEIIRRNKNEFQLGLKTEELLDLLTQLEAEALDIRILSNSTFTLIAQIRHETEKKNEDALYPNEVEAHLYLETIEANVKSIISFLTASKTELIDDAAAFKQLKMLIDKLSKTFSILDDLQKQYKQYVAKKIVIISRAQGYTITFL